MATTQDSLDWEAGEYLLNDWDGITGVRGSEDEEIELLGRGKDEIIDTRALLDIDGEKAIWKSDLNYEVVEVGRGYVCVNKRFIKIESQRKSRERRIGERDGHGRNAVYFWD
jgi:hypothetical protein